MAARPTWDRRRVLLGIAALPAAASLPACAPQSEPPRPTLADTDIAALRRVLGDAAVGALSYAALAPSGHNTQPWTVDVIGPAHWRIGSSAERRLPAVDPAGRETWLSIGAFLENLIVAAHAAGLAIEYDIADARPPDAPVVDLRLRKDVAIPYPLARLTARRTVRRGYLTDPLSPAVLRAVVGDDSGLHHFPRNSPGARQLAEATIAANRRQAFRDDAQRELADWIRWRRADELRYRTGLTPASMEITGVAGWYTRLFYDRESVLANRFRQQGIEQVVERVAQGAGWLVQTGGTGVAELVETGRRFERMWLRLRELRVAIHPMTQAIEETPDTAELSKSLGIDGVPQFLLRIGHVADYPDPVSPRLALSAFTRLPGTAASER